MLMYATISLDLVDVTLVGEGFTAQNPVLLVYRDHFVQKAAARVMDFVMSQTTDVSA